MTVQEREHPGYLSACHRASVHVEDGSLDFYGAPGTFEGRTCWFVCDECGEACNVVERVG